MSYKQEYNEQPIYELDLQYSDNSQWIRQHDSTYKTCTEATVLVVGRPERSLILGSIGRRKGFLVVPR